MSLNKCPNRHSGKKLLMRALPRVTLATVDAVGSLILNPTPRGTTSLGCDRAQASTLPSAPALWFTSSQTLARGSLKLDGELPPHDGKRSRPTLLAAMQPPTEQQGHAQGEPKQCNSTTKPKQPDLGCDI